ncbi:hypothetical protein A2U01_0064109, partial [Trifolium medium]|nr:hypothetical protein [Trifolium medium]
CLISVVFKELQHSTEPPENRVEQWLMEPWLLELQSLTPLLLVEVPEFDEEEVELRKGI